MTYCSLTPDRVCYAAVATIAKKERAGTTSTRGHLRALERDGFLEAVGSRKADGRLQLYTGLARGFCMLKRQTIQT